MKPRSIAMLSVALALGCGPGSSAGPPEPRPVREGPEPSPVMLEEAAEDFDEVRTGFLEWYFETHPVRASELGVHTHDARLPALDRVGIQDRIEDLLDWLADLEQIPFGLMEGDGRYDYAILEYAIRAELLALEESRDWATDPRLYTGVVARGVASVAEREYEPLGARVDALVARMGAMDAVLRAARENVTRPPRVWTEMAIEDARGLVRYLEERLPGIIAEQHVGDSVPSLLEAASGRLVQALDDHIAWLEGDLLPRSSGSFRLGRYLLERQLLYREHVSLGLDELERLNGEAIAEYQRRLEELAAQIDPDRAPREVIDSINGRHPAPEQLIVTARELTEAARDWVVASGVVAVPHDELPTVRETPAFARGVFSSLDAPGPFETERLEAFFNLTNVRPDWDEALQAEHLSYFSDAGLMVTTLHETFPGRYVQRQYERDVTDLRRVFTARSFTDGWAHYAEEMALDEGFTDDPAVRLIQLQRALERHARWYAIIRLHAMDDAIDDVVRAYMDIAHVPEFPARRAVARATGEPSFLSDALGRMQILELRRDYQAYLEERDREFSLAEFHQQLLRLGLPFPLARESLIPTRRAPQRRRGFR